MLFNKIVENLRSEVLIALNSYKLIGRSPLKCDSYFGRNWCFINFHLRAAEIVDFGVNCFEKKKKRSMLYICKIVTKKIKFLQVLCNVTE